MSVEYCSKGQGKWDVRERALLCNGTKEAHEAYAKAIAAYRQIIQLSNDGKLPMQLPPMF